MLRCRISIADNDWNEEDDEDGEKIMALEEQNQGELDIPDRSKGTLTQPTNCVHIFISKTKWKLVFSFPSESVRLFVFRAACCPYLCRIGFQFCVSCAPCQFSWFSPPPAVIINIIFLQKTLIFRYLCFSICISRNVFSSLLSRYRFCVTALQT